MWLAAWLWAQKGVGMGVGWGGLHFHSRGNAEQGEGHFQNVGDPEPLVGQGEGSIFEVM